MQKADIHLLKQTKNKCIIQYLRGIVDASG